MYDKLERRHALCPYLKRVVTHIIYADQNNIIIFQLNLVDPPPLYLTHGRIQGGGRVSAPLANHVGFLTLGPKLDPLHPPFFCL